MEKIPKSKHSLNPSIQRNLGMSGRKVLLEVFLVFFSYYFMFLIGKGTIQTNKENITKLIVLINIHFGDYLNFVEECLIEQLTEFTI